MSINKPNSRPTLEEAIAARKARGSAEKPTSPETESANTLPKTPEKVETKEVVKTKPTEPKANDIRNAARARALKYKDTNPAIAEKLTAMEEAEKSADLSQKQSANFLASELLNLINTTHSPDSGSKYWARIANETYNDTQSIDDLKDKIAEPEFQGLYSQMTTITDRINTEVNKYNSLDKNKQNLNTELTNLTTTINQTETELNTLLEKLHLSPDNAELRAKRNSLSNELIDLKQQKRSVSSKIDEINESHKKLQETLKEAQLLKTKILEESQKIHFKIENDENFNSFKNYIALLEVKTSTSTSPSA